MKVLFLIPPPLEEDCNVVRDVLYGCTAKGKRIAGATAPPLVGISVCTVLKNEGHEVRLLDAPAENKSLNDILSMVKAYDAVLILTSTMTVEDDSKILEMIKDSNPNITTIMLGAHPTFMSESCLKKKVIDIIIKKEPEFIIRDLINILDKGGESWKKIKGIGFRDNGKIIINEDYDIIENLDLLPIGDVSLLPKNVEYYNPLIKRYPYISSETSRGCPGRCSFCTAPAMYGRKLRCWSKEKVIQEIEQRIREGYKEIYYRDETFTTFKKRNVEICKEIIDKKLDISWLCNVRVGTADKETLALMKKAGCHTIKTGVESGVQEILDKSNKGIKVWQTTELFKWAKDVGINTHAHLMIGMPGETKETLETTLEFIKKLNPTSIDVGICTPYPGTELFETLAEKLPELRKDYSIRLKDLHITGKYNKYFTELGDAELHQYLSRFYKEFYLRPSHAIGNILQIRNKSDLKRTLNASLSLLRFIRNKAND